MSFISGFGVRVRGEGGCKADDDGFLSASSCRFAFENSDRRVQLSGGRCRGNCVDDVSEDNMTNETFLFHTYIFFF